MDGQKELPIKLKVCSSPRYSWVTYFILSNICNFSQLVFSILSTHTLFALSIFVSLSIFSRLIKLMSVSQPLLSIHFLRYLATYKCTRCAHHKHNSFSCLIVRTLSAPIYPSNSPGVFGHRAIPTMGGGGSDRGWGFPHRTNRSYHRLSKSPRQISKRPSCSFQMRSWMSTATGARLHELLLPKNENVRLLPVFKESNQCSGDN